MKLFFNRKVKLNRSLINFFLDETLIKLFRPPLGLPLKASFGFLCLHFSPSSGILRPPGVTCLPGSLPPSLPWSLASRGGMPLLSDVLGDSENAFQRLLKRNLEGVQTAFFFHEAQTPRPQFS